MAQRWQAGCRHSVYEVQEGLWSAASFNPEPTVLRGLEQAGNTEPETLEKAHRNVPLFSIILFVDPGTDSKGSVDVTYDMVIRKPDGSIYGEQKNAVGLKGKFVIPAHDLQLAQERMGIRIDNQDPSGTYTVEVTVRDHIKKVDLPLKATFKVAP